MVKRSKILLGLLGIACIITASAKTLPYQTIIESNTPAILNTISKNAKNEQIDKLPMGQIIEWTSLQLLDKPYVGALLDKKVPEYLYISLNSTDCMLFVEHVLAVSYLIKHNDLNLKNLTSLVKDERYHGALAYCNRNHYFKDWALTNQHKGLVYDAALPLTGIDLPYSAHVMSDWIKNQPNSLHYSDLACIQKRETLINQEKIGFIPLKILPHYIKDIQAGDIIGIVRTPKGRADSIHHLAIAYLHNGKVGLVDASSDYKRVVIAPSLMGYLAQFQDSEGIILFRAK